MVLFTLTWFRVRFLAGKMIVIRSFSKVFTTSCADFPGRHVLFLLPVSRMDALSNQAMVFRFCHLLEEQGTVTLTNQNQSGSLGVLFESTWIHSRSIFQTLSVSVKTFRQILPIFRRFSARLEGCHRFSGFSNAAKGKHVSLYRFV